MVSNAPLWSVVVAPVVLAALAWVAVTWHAVLSTRAAGGHWLGTGGISGRGALDRRVLAAPLWEATSLLVQQRRVTPAADGLLRRLGTGGVAVAAMLAVLVVPLGNHAVSDLSVGVVWFNAMEIVVWAALWLTGWGSNSAYALIAGYRFVAQGLAYELPHMFALVTAAVGAGSLRVGQIIAAQDGLWFVVWMPAAFVLFLVSALAMAFWTPFDQPVAADVAGGVAVELSGVDRLVLVAGRYLLLAAASAMAVPLFLGGGSGPLLPAWAWSVLKTLAVLGVLVWLRTRVPTVRMDRFTEVSWMVLVPVALLQALVVAVVVLVR
jgi:NADH-quinone oxidoreductase subunit H